MDDGAQSHFNSINGIEHLTWAHQFSYTEILSFIPQFHTIFCIAFADKNPTKIPEIVNAFCYLVSGAQIEVLSFQVLRNIRNIV